MLLFDFIGKRSNKFIEKTPDLRMIVEIINKADNRDTEISEILMEINRYRESHDL
jgi:hypothetical protein